MSKKLNVESITSELSGSGFFPTSPTPSQNVKDNKSEIKVVTEAQTSKRPNVNTDVLKNIIEYIDNVETNRINTPIYFDNEEKELLELFLNELVHKHGLRKRDITLAKLMRLCTLYMLKENKESLISSFKAYFKKDVSLPK